MRRISIFLRTVLILGLSVCGAESSPTYAEETPPMVPRQVLLKKTVPLSADTVETRVIRVQFPSGYKTPLHTHEGPGPRYVLKGRLRVEDSGERRVYGPGDVFWEISGKLEPP